MSLMESFACCCQVNMLRERNKSYGTIKFVDISSDGYSPEDNLGLDYEAVSLYRLYSMIYAMPIVESESSHVRNFISPCHVKILYVFLS